MKLMYIILSFTVLFAGCYSSELIDLKGEDRQETHSTEIEYVVTIDGKTHHFDTPPTLVKDGIAIGPAGSEEIKIRSIGISYVIMKDGTRCTFEQLTGSVNDTAAITPPIDMVKTNSTVIEYVITKDGTKYMFEGTTAVVHDTIIGVLKAKAAPGFADDPTVWITTVKGTEILIPISDAAQVRISEFNAGSTNKDGAGTVALGAGLVVAASVGLLLVLFLVSGGIHMGGN